MRTRSDPLARIAAAFLCLLTGLVHAAGPTVPIAYFTNWDTDMNFYTVTPSEMDRFAPFLPYQGWNRLDTVASYEPILGSMRAWPTADSAPPEAVPVCRFYWAARGLHFYTAFAAECGALITAGRPWLLEDASSFYVLLPDATTGACPAGSAPVFRLLEHSTGDHFFTASLDFRTTFLAEPAQRTSEGYGPLGVGFCSPTAE